MWNTCQRVIFFCRNIAAGDDGVSWKFFCLIKSYMVAIWPSKELQRSTIIFFWLIIRKNLRAHVIDFYWKMLSNSKWSLHWTIMHLFYESFNKIWICARKKLAKMNHENRFFLIEFHLLSIWMCTKHKTKMLRFHCPITSFDCARKCAAAVWHSILIDLVPTM